MATDMETGSADHLLFTQPKVSDVLTGSSVLPGRSADSSLDSDIPLVLSASSTLPPPFAGSESVEAPAFHAMDHFVNEMLAKTENMHAPLAWQRGVIKPKSEENGAGTDLPIHSIRLCVEFNGTKPNANRAEEAGEKISALHNIAVLAKHAGFGIYAKKPARSDVSPYVCYHSGAAAAADQGNTPHLLVTLTGSSELINQLEQALNTPNLDSGKPRVPHWEELAQEFSAKKTASPGATF